LTDNRIYEQVHENLLQLNMHTAESIIDSVLELAVSKEMSPIDVINQILGEEVKTRRTSAIMTRTKLAGFPVRKTLDEFDFTYQPSIDRKVVDELRSLRFVYNMENVVFLGPPGVGKTHLSIGLGVDAINAGFSVYYITAAAMLDRLKQASARGSFDRKLKTLAKYRLLIVDEIGYLPMDREGAHLFFQLVSKRYEKSSTIFTSNKTYSEWGEVLGDSVIASAILDRILHHSITVNVKGESYRLKSRKKAGLKFPPPAMEEKV
jgi:DNA replication protein DnaC